MGDLILLKIVLMENIKKEKDLNDKIRTLSTTELQNQQKQIDELTNKIKFEKRRRNKCKSMCLDSKKIRKKIPLKYRRSSGSIKRIRRTKIRNHYKRKSKRRLSSKINPVAIVLKIK